jgi:hypothetical protein
VGLRDIQSDSAMTFEKATSRHAVIVRKFYNEVDWPLSGMDWPLLCLDQSCDKGFIKQNAVQT